MNTIARLGLFVLLFGTYVNAQTTVSAVSPAQHALNVSASTTIQVTFSNAMLTSMTDDQFIVSGMTSGRHRGNLDISSDSTVVTFTPFEAFARGEIVTVNLASSIQDADTAAITPFVYSFTVQTNISTGSFATGVTYATGDAPFSVIVSDVDNDGDGDLVVANSSADSVSVLKNNGDGTFAPKTDYPVGADPSFVFAGDLDGDGDGDIVVANHGRSGGSPVPASISVLKNNGDGTFAAKVDYASGAVDLPNAPFVSDLDGDGDGDIAVVNGNSSANTVSLLINNGDGTFGTNVDYTINLSSNALFISDLDGDGDGDMAIVSDYSNTVSILKNNGDGTFSSKVDYAAGSSPNAVFISDLDGDGDGDIAVANISEDSVSVLKNNGDGTFAAKVQYAAGDAPYAIFIHDADGDGDGDILAANSTSGTISILKNNGDGTFAPKVDYTTGANPLSLFVSDFNGDGIGDIVTANGVEDKVYVLMGRETSSPSATTDSTSSVGTTVAALHGTVNANNASTTVRFVYGTVSGTYTDSVTAAESPATGLSNTTVSASLSGLLPGTTYYFRVAATNLDGYVRGSELNFTTSSTGGAGYALQFDGNDDVSSNLVMTVTDNLTMEAWVKWDGTTDVNQLIIYNGHPGFSGYGIVLNPFTLPDSNLGILCGGVAYMASTTTVTANVWHHVAAVRTSGVWELYLDGMQLTLSSSSVVPITPASTTHMGQNNFKGVLDEIRLWNVARTEAEIQSTMNQILNGNETGLVAYWRFDEGAGTTTVDLTSNNNDGTINGATWVASSVSLIALSATTNAATNVGNVTATVNGTVNADGESTTVRFLYGTVSDTYTDSVTASQSPVTGTTNTSVSATLSGLTVNTTYYFRVTASNTNGYRRGSEMNFTTSNGVTSAGYALEFDGVNDYVNMGNAPAFSVGAAVTYEAWINPYTTHNGYIFNKWVGFAEDKTFIFSGNRVHFYLFNVFNSSFLSSTSTIPFNQFTHVAATYDGSTAKIYINGVLDASKSVSSGTSNSSGSFYIGHNAERGDSNNPFRGIMDEFRIWNVARTEAEIQSTMNQVLVGNETGLVGYWNFDEGTGTTTADLTSNGNDGTISGAMWIASTVALPVELVSFSASAKHNGIELQWSTATETNNYGFEIERKQIPLNPPLQGGSRAAGEVGGFVKIGFVEGNGTTNSPKEYSFTENNLSSGKPALPAGRYSYRLKQIDRDGKFSYSQEVEVTIGNTPKEFALEQNYPNPFNPTTMINYQLPVSGRVSLKVYDAIGREVRTLVNEVKGAGSYSVQFDGTNLSSGIYFARLQSGDKMQLKKMMLLK